MENNFTIQQRLATSKNEYQGDYKRVLCLCTAGLLRSPTAAWVLSNEPYNYNTRSAGTYLGDSLNLVDSVLIEWADEIVCMQDHHLERIIELGLNRNDKKFIVLGIPDNFKYRDPTLINLIRESYDRERGYL
jgi:predicted protein tyrosine phosphatase